MIKVISERSKVNIMYQINLISEVRGVLITDRQTFVILELLLQLKKNFAWIMLQCNKVKDT